MATLTLNFANPINVSLQANTGDIIYFKRSSDDKIIKLGECIAIRPASIDVSSDASTPRPIAGDFIFFAKDPEISTTGLAGYYAEVKMEIISASKKELFAVSSEIFISS